MKRLFMILLALLIIIPLQSGAQIPRNISYQGVLADSVSGNAIDGKSDFVFKLFDAEAGGVPIWKSDVKALKITKGLFSTGLGPFGPEVKFDKPYWLDIEVAGKVLSPRIPLTSVGYSLSSLRADTAMVSLASIASWLKNGSDIYRIDGNVGIGTSTPASKLDLSGGPTWTTASWAKSLRLSQGSAIQFDAKSDSKFGIGATYPGNNLYFFSTTTDGNTAAANYRMVINANGNVGIGTTGPSEKLHVAGSLHLSGNHAGSNRVVFSHESAIGKQWELYPHKDYFLIYNRTDRQAPLTILNNGNVGIGTTNPTSKFDVAGTTTTKVLEITGGADIAEPFEITENESLSRRHRRLHRPRKPRKTATIYRAL